MWRGQAGRDPGSGWERRDPGVPAGSHPRVHSDCGGGLSDTCDIPRTVSQLPVPSASAVCLQQVKPVAPPCFSPCLGSFNILPCLCSLRASEIQTQSDFSQRSLLTNPKMVLMPFSQRHWSKQCPTLHGPLLLIFFLCCSLAKSAKHQFVDADCSQHLCEGRRHSHSRLHICVTFSANLSY